MNNKIKSQIRHLIVGNKVERVELTALLNNLLGESSPVEGADENLQEDLLSANIKIEELEATIEELKKEAESKEFDLNKDGKLDKEDLSIAGKTSYYRCTRSL